MTLADIHIVHQDHYKMFQWENWKVLESHRKQAGFKSRYYTNDHSIKNLGVQQQ